ncbi:MULTISPECIES: hypothetical protein [unclassified Chryseobacterium]|uniref:hypothetical protein n=1 Tax=unclassified Chryseobacterium TaxID=2593645 RepID=UPI00100ADB5E|nr:MULTISPECIES: hypothetical protein [unclassified Chryseobacterium]RXM50924.1 hypothetical protein BOQ64_15790 [Chryseobacterium sp. CH25]RXM62088.1 hypothetical protein BOQ60_21545 [Chryseobacterium sp. CH1]
MKVKWGISLLFIISILTFLTYWNYNNRTYDWDMPGYLGSMFTTEFPDSPEKVRELTFSSIKKEASADQYNNLIGVKPWAPTRQYFAKNTQSFTEQLPYFQIKIGYVLVITLFCKLGLSPPMSVLFTGLISYFISGLLLFYTIKILFPEKYILAALLTAGIMLMPTMTYMSGESTPDMFIFLFLLIFVIGLIKSWSKWSIFLLLLVMIFIRPDYITFALTYLGAIFLYSYFAEKKMEIILIVQGIVMLSIYASIMKLYNYPGWTDLFYDSFIYRRPIISSQPAHVSLDIYLQIIYTKIIAFKKVTLAVSIMTGLIFWISKDTWIRMIAALFFVNVYIKFFFFPQSGDLRLFFPFIFPLFIMILLALSQKYNHIKSSKIV